MADLSLSRNTIFCGENISHLRITFSLSVITITLSELFFANDFAKMREISKMFLDLNQRPRFY